MVEKSSEKLFLYQAQDGSTPQLVRDFNSTTGQSGGATDRDRESDE